MTSQDDCAKGETGVKGEKRTGGIDSGACVSASASGRFPCVQRFSLVSQLADHASRARPICAPGTPMLRSAADGHGCLGQSAPDRLHPRDRGRHLRDQPAEAGEPLLLSGGARQSARRIRHSAACHPNAAPVGLDRDAQSREFRRLVSSTRPGDPRLDADLGGRAGRTSLELERCDAGHGCGSYDGRQRLVVPSHRARAGRQRVRQGVRSPHHRWPGSHLAPKQSLG